MIDPFKPYYCKRIGKQVAAEYMCDLINRKFIVCKHYNSSNNRIFPCMQDPSHKRRKCLVQLTIEREIRRGE
ncbi:MAG: hypothetical protein NTU63_00060 [Candidatus Pacearchaeota archaeon]|nr:hypothetical protein [Candidatus Pacearchaeota archaeon]